MPKHHPLAALAAAAWGRAMTVKEKIEAALGIIETLGPDVHEAAAQHLRAALEEWPEVITEPRCDECAFSNKFGAWYCTITMQDTEGVTDRYPDQCPLPVLVVPK